MSQRWRWLLVALLVMIPPTALCAAGAWTLWQAGLWRWLWWLVPLCWGLAYLLLRREFGRPLVDASVSLPAMPQWTEQDRLAVRLVEEMQQEVQQLSPQQLTEGRCYLDTALKLAQRVAHHYHPHARDPLGGLTLLEILTCIQLASEECERWVREHLPGSHLLTVDQWRQLAKAPGWLRTASNLGWAAAVVIDPVNLGRFASSRLFVDPTRRAIQSNVLTSMYIAYVRYVGLYLIELNSGRLRGGPERYREFRSQLPLSDVASAPRSPEAPGATRSGPPAGVTLALVGQVNAGKSSLINALLGAAQAETDVLPRTAHVQRYRLQLTARPDQLVLLDTPGYAAEGATAAEVAETAVAIRQADLVLVLLQATQPARQADAQLLAALAARWADRPHEKRPPVVAVLTHIDNLSPLLEWEPPYNWSAPSRAKEKSLAAAMQYNRAVVGSDVDSLVPVCLAPGKTYGVDEWLLPVVLAKLDEARACALLRTLHRDWDEDRVRHCWRQFVNLGRVVLKQLTS